MKIEKLMDAFANPLIVDTRKESFLIWKMLKTFFNWENLQKKT